MKCFQCKNEIKNEIEMIVTAPDGDCYCNLNCYSKFKTLRENFFNNIDDDDWYEQWWNK